MQSVTFRTHAVKSTVLLTVIGLAVMSIMLCSCAKKPGLKSSASVQGVLFDTPTLFPDGSTRFHIIEDAASKSEEMINVPAGGTIVGGITTSTLLLEETFEDGKKPDWQDKTGTTTVEDGMLVAGNGRNEVILANINTNNVMVIAEMKAHLQGGILARYVDPDNYILAYIQPAQKILAFHEKVNGNFGPSLGATSLPQITDPRVRMTVKIIGDKAELMLEDSQSQIARTECTLSKLKDSGGIGFYHDTSVGDEPQSFDNFQVSRIEVSPIEHIVPANAIQVVIPADVMSDDFIWMITDRIQVKGVEGSGQAIDANLRAVTIKQAADIKAIEKTEADNRLFPVRTPAKNWFRFPAEGFSEPACGVVYQMSDRVTNGMALGGIDTGCIDLETSGLLGYCTIFNTHVPRRGPLNLPVLGISVNDKTWALCRKQPKLGDGGAQKPVEPVFTDLKLEGVQTVNDIRYWGHYPVADLEFLTDAPVSIGLRAWTPFLPGNVQESMVPGIVFEAHVRNTSPSKQQGTIAFSFPGPTKLEAGCETFDRQQLDGQFKGVKVTGNLASYAIGVMGDENIRIGGELGADGLAWANISKSLPATEQSAAGASTAVDFALAPGDEKIVRFTLTWDAPTWKGGGYNWAEGGNVFQHMYAKYYTDAEKTGDFLAQNHKDLLARTLAWQQVVYTDTKIPVWLRDSLINILYCMTEDSHWAQREEPLLAWTTEEDGLFGLNECPRGCPQIECIPCSFYGSLPLVYFWPELQLSTIRGYKQYQGEDGRPPWTFGSPIELCAPSYTQYQSSTNGISLAGIVDRFLMCRDTEDKQYLKELYPMIKKTMDYNVNLGVVGNPTYSLGEQVMAMPNIEGNLEWFETQAPGWQGVAAHIGILRLAQLGITRRMAEEMGDTEYVKQCDEWTQLAVEALENRLWDSRGYYLNFFEPVSGNKSEFVFGYQLDGEWVLDHHGLPSPLPVERVHTVLDTIKNTNIALTKYGAVNYANPDGTVANPGGYGSYSYFPPEALMLSMNYMYEGQVEFGTELARKVWHNIFCLQGYSWDVPNIMRGDVDTGERTFGNDYYQDMMLWSLPAAIQGKDVSAPCKPGGLVDRMIKAAAKK